LPVRIEEKAMSLERGLIGLALAVVGAGLWSAPANAQQPVQCSSPKFAYKECNVPWTHSELVRRTSDADCIEGQSWGQREGIVWVIRGCAASFGPARQGGGWGPGGGGQMECNSERNGYRECPTDWRNARLVRQTSNARCVEGESWGLRRGVLWVDRGCAAVFAESRGGRPGWGGGGSGQQQIECNSDRNSYKACRTGDWRSARLVRQTSRAQCVEGRSWGYERGTLWVDNGCAGTFAAAQGGGWGGGGGWNGGGNAGGRLTCESEKNAYRECRADGWRGADVARKISRAACVEGQSWGLRRGVLWVDRGCAADFVETRR
jgi:hypothetical protein